MTTAERCKQAIEKMNASAHWLALMCMVTVDEGDKFPADLIRAVNDFRKAREEYCAALEFRNDA